MSLYDPIDFQSRGIRIMHLVPGSFDDEIRMTLNSIHLNDSLTHHYEALSYVWGIMICPRPALLNGRAFSITHNLDTALRHLRHSSKARVLWVDAVCINQQDDEEKSSQVQLMPDIYSKATKVIVWLGPADNDSTMFLDCVDEKEIADNTNVNAILEAALGFFSRHWFTRTWVLQEFKHATKEPEMLCGFRSTLLSRAYFFLCDLHTAFDVYWGKAAAAQVIVAQEWSTYLQNLASSMATWCATVSRETAEDYQRKVGARMFFTEPMLLVHQALKSNGEISTTVNKHSETIDEGLAINRNALFPSVLHKFAHLEATLPVDKIYGILGMCKFEGNAILPDYSRPVGSVYAQAMAHILFSGFEYGYPVWPAGIESSTAATFKLPSWVPDFSRGAFLNDPAQTERLGNLYRMCDPRALTRATRETGRCFPFVAFMDDYQTLYAGGVEIGIICESWPLWEPRCKPSMKNLAQVVLQVQKKRVSRDALLDALSGAVKSTIAKSFVPPSEKLCTDCASQRPWDDGVLQAAPSSPARVLFLTNDGHTGITEGSVCQGDLIVGLFGINFPVVLRWLDGAFKMVNTAHIAYQDLGHESIPMDVTEEDLLEIYGFKIYAIE